MSKQEKTPKLAGTVLLVRDAADFEVLMVKRHYQIDFAAGALVFPGGKAHDEDGDPRWNALTDGDYSGEAMTVRIASVREAFEESGVLLAREQSARGAGGPLVGAETADRLAPMRGAIDRREESFLELIETNGLVLALDRLVHFGHWVTPDMMPKRFDTHFFLAKTPDAQIASHDGRETTDAVWLNPAEALAMQARKEAEIIFPTRMNLIKLARAQSSREALAMYADAPVVRVLPVIGKTETGKPCLNIPEEAGYGHTVELLENVMP